MFNVGRRARARSCRCDWKKLAGCWQDVPAHPRSAVTLNVTGPYTSGNVTIGALSTARAHFGPGFMLVRGGVPEERIFQVIGFCRTGASRIRENPYAEVNRRY